MFLDSGKCFGFWDVFLDSGKCFGFWDVFLDSGKCFWILGSALILGSVLDSRTWFWILETVLSLRATVDRQSRSMFQWTVFFKQVSLMEFHFFQVSETAGHDYYFFFFLNLLVACSNWLTYSG